DPFGSEPIWLLREGTSATPFNLDTLFLWTLLLGLLRQAGPGAETDEEVAAVCKMLGDDLEAGDPWLVPLKGGTIVPAAGGERLTHGGDVIEFEWPIAPRTAAGAAPGCD